MPRLFIAIDADSAQRRKLSSIATDELSARWTPADQLHCTLRFLGDTSDDDLKAVEDRLSEIDAAPLPLHGRGLGVFPSLRNPRVLWARVARHPALLELHHQIESAVQELAFAPDRHDFTPHITLARLKDADAEQVYRFVQQHRDWSYPNSLVREFILYQSELTPEGALHTPVAHYPLRG